MKERSIKQVEQVFSYTAPGALRVQLAGSFTGWQSKPISMTKSDDGIWRTKVKLPPGSYQYRFIVDGQWHDDPTCTLRVSNEFGSSNMLREVRAA
jgi:1,4-alpha-glucan branching enzyme